MWFLVPGYYKHKRVCQQKQAEREQRLCQLRKEECDEPLTSAEIAIVDGDIVQLVSDVQTGKLDPHSVLSAYAKVALRAQEKTNCVTEIMVNSAHEWLRNGDINLEGPLAGIPISLKDNIAVGGFDTTVGYSKFIGNKSPHDGAMTRLLKAAGAVPYVKTNVPITLLSFESTNDVWGRCTNPHNSDYSPGGSTGGEAALIALGGRIGIGSDVAGSVRVPAHWSGIYSLRCSTGRWPKHGMCTSMPGQEGVPSVFSPMARTIRDLSYFTKSLIRMEPWKYDCTVHPLPWREEIFGEYSGKRSLRVGIMRTDGVVDPSPACKRALETTEAALRQAGHTIVEIDPPSPYEALYLGAHLLNADGCRTFKTFFSPGEWEDSGARQMSFLMGLPRAFKYIYYLWVKYIRRDPVWADLVKDWHHKSAQESWQLVSRREAYRMRWFQWWNDENIDFLLAPPNATPSLPHDGMKEAVSSCGYTFLFNVLDYTSGVLPVLSVDKDLDGLPASFDINRLNGVARGAYKLYDADAMHGLPVGVQVVGRRLEEEKVLGIMELVEEALHNHGVYYQQLRMTS
ncbi:hypothetical protein jhhlp_004463 [Lomentospora prolificans]|uniref:amidase n=1 Tax=Lomentospora prolificans TaxID=41688 RepID=A0A2N3NBM5_9PEZI|nr:hypothetical protein jhhlp_004463 [Lomentospora prolificans]